MSLILASSLQLGRCEGLAGKDPSNEPNRARDQEWNPQGKVSGDVTLQDIDQQTTNHRSERHRTPPEESISTIYASKDF